MMIKNNNNSRAILIVLTLLLSFSCVLASDIVVQKTVFNSQVQFDEWFSINLKITNNKATSIIADIYELQPEIFDYQDYEPFRQEGIWYVPPSINIQRAIPANSFIIEEFVVKSYQIGNFYIPKTAINVNGQAYFSNSLEINVLCNQNNLCEQSLNENYQNCLSDCSTGSQDGICDKVSDGRVDPDCSSSYFDPDYVPDNCSNRIKDSSELGVDCGYICNWDCVDGSRPLPTCYDNAQNQGETDIDCGGPCVACPTCSDGIKNQGETHIDCGGPCVACPTCFNGIKDQDEYWTDCGGVCGSCFKSGGIGTQEDPYIITNCYELQYIDTDATAHYELSNNIDCSDTINWNNGKGFTPIIDSNPMSKSFKGTLDGKGFVIKDLYINDIYNGALIDTMTGTVKNLGLENIYVNAQMAAGGFAVRVLGRLENCYVTGNVISQSGSAGGLMGFAAHHTQGPHIINCYSIAFVEGGDNSGGLMSVNYRSGSSCTHHDYDRNLTGLYWDVETSNQDNDGTICSEGKTTGEMKNYSTYVGWDFDNVWAINPSINEGYPYLKSESVELLAQSSTSFSDSGAGNGGETASSGGGGGSVDYGDLQINTSEKSSDSGKARQISTNLQEFFEDEDSQKTTFIILGAIILLVIIIALIVLFFKRKRYSNKNIPVEGKL